VTSKPHGPLERELRMKCNFKTHIYMCGKLLSLQLFQTVVSKRKEKRYKEIMILFLCNLIVILILVNFN